MKFMYSFIGSIFALIACWTLDAGMHGASLFLSLIAIGMFLDGVAEKLK